MNNFLHGLYAITNEQLMPSDTFAKKAEAALCGGTNIIQYRDKSSDIQKRLSQASTLKQLCTQYNSILIINDDIDLAKKVDADGVHIGKNDQSFEQARQLLGENKIIGVSCYNQLPLAYSAAEKGADYIAFGSFFSSSIKPEAPCAETSLISDFKKERQTPVCCIGGITTENYTTLLNSGADMLAVISDIFSHNQTQLISDKCRTYTDAFKS